jgi:large subunit ribosomal protein L21
VYAIVRTGGHQHRVAVGDTLQVNRLSAALGESVTLPAVLLVDDAGTVTSDAAKLSAARITAEIVEHGKGPKIIIRKFRNKTG